MTKKNPQEIFTKPILGWWGKSGRKDLPWQKDTSLYKTWVSEIMLQQTQVKTVIPYFLKFISEYSSIEKLARADESEVMAHWSGLGYYLRARNLHKAAKIIKNDYDGYFPKVFDQIVALPGIGPSTAGAILSLNKIEPRPIMDGNAKRVLSRHFFVQGDLNKADLKKRMWKLSESCTPEIDYDIYTQAIMDLGATICLPKKYDCTHCPVNETCIAKKKNKVELIPYKKTKKQKKKIEYNFLVIRSKHRFLLELRETSGIWPGLWSFPVLETTEKISHWMKKNTGIENIEGQNHLQSFIHSLTHIDIKINPIVINLAEEKYDDLNEKMMFMKAQKIHTVGTSKAVKKIIDRL